LVAARLADRLVSQYRFSVLLKIYRAINISGDCHNEGELLLTRSISKHGAQRKCTEQSELYRYGESKSLRCCAKSIPVPKQCLTTYCKNMLSVMAVSRVPSVI